jgi:hypothetical protein
MWSRRLSPRIALNTCFPEEIPLAEQSMKRANQAVRRREVAPKPASGSALPAREIPQAGSASVPAEIFMANANDRLAIERLRTTRAGELAVDLLVRGDPKMVSQLREAMISVYLNAAQKREMSKATRRQISKARSALASLESAIDYLENASTDGREGLTRLLLGPPSDDEKGERETNAFASACYSLKLAIVPHAMKLQTIIEAENKKSWTTGEKPKRLRSLSEALVSWYLRGGGKSIAPYVKANRRDDGPAIVHYRSGKFLELAVALFCYVDVFKRSEVEAAVSNVHEARLTSERHRKHRG